MTKSPVLWGAGLVCALGGAIAGNALGSTPPLHRSTVAMMYQSHDIAIRDATAREPLPDHYPLVTRRGTVPVAELSTRGLYSQARYRAYLHAADYDQAELAAADYRPDEELVRYQGTDQSIRIGDPDVGRERADPAPLQLAAGPATVATLQGNAKLIDVEATLAMR